ncbi:MAG: hypothetical protein HY819_05340 [Acidobacteria bacterium]|nr:hypothetical protein [Acidobacteriota bacterium]
MNTNKKRYLLTMGLILAISIPADKIIKSNVSASRSDNDTDSNLISNIEKFDTSQSEVSKRIELALYKETEFFSTSTLVPYPTASARNQLLEIAKHYPNNIDIYKKLAELEIELSNKDQAEKYLLKSVDLSKNNKASLRELASFYEKQARFEKQADTLSRILEVTENQEQGEILTELISLADKHSLDKYLGAQFYQKILNRYPDNLIILEQYIETLIENKDYQKALKLVNDYRQNTPDSDYYFLNKQADILLKINKWQEAKELYIKVFDPFWPDYVNQKFYYEVLSDNNQLRAYGRDLRREFEKTPSNFDLAICLIHYDTQNSSYDYDSSNNLNQYVFYKLEEARSKNNIGWQAKELNILARISLQKGQAERASRYIYTLYNQGELKPTSELRGQLLYQLFELLMDAQYQRLPLTTGNLNFYQDIARTDTNPGVIGGILSLIFSDTKPKNEFSDAQTSAIKYFNQAAAHRIFHSYKKEYPTSPQLAQMYLDIIKLYIQENNTELANETLKEFEERYKESNKFADVAIKLADAYIINNDYEKELAVYQQILDYLGKKTNSGQPLQEAKNKLPRKHFANSDDDYGSDEGESNKTIEAPLLEPTNSVPTTSFQEFNTDLKINQPSTTNENYYYNYDSPRFNDYLAENQSVSYELVLNRYIFKLNKNNRTKEIIELFNREIKKYPKEEALYEQLLQWLGQTNLVNDQLAVYQKAIKQFPTTNWYDRLARWLIRQKRDQEFADYSKELLSKFDEVQVTDYLNQFVTSYSYSDFDKKLYLSLYSYAHNRFPQNHDFVQGLLRYYIHHNQLDKWQALVGRYYFIWPEIRNDYLTFLSQKKELRKYLATAKNKLINSSENTNLLPYKLFRADAAIWLCSYEEAIDAYRELNRLYPGNSVFAQQLVNLSRSFGQLQPKFLTEATNVQFKQVSLNPGSVDDRVRAGELYAEANDYQKAKVEWLKLLELGKDKQTYLDTATIFWDYYQYDDALKVIEKFRQEKNDKTLLAFETGAILEAKHQIKAAIREYVKGLNKNEEDYYKVKERLAVLYERDEALSKEIQRAFSSYYPQTKSPEKFILGYVEVLKIVNQEEKASSLLKQAIKETKSIEFLEQAGEFFQEQKDAKSEIRTIELRLKYINSFREDIAYRLRLISVYRQNNDKQKAIKLLQELLNKYPSNYGVINEIVNIYWNMGLTKNAVATLDQAVLRSRGKYYYEFSRRLAARHLNLNNTKIAQNILENLFNKDRLNSQVLDELANLYIRTNNRKALEECLKEGLKAVESQYMDPTELRSSIAYFRQDMIEKFTSIKDYNAAIRQHIEIINRNPDDEEKLDQAILYTERYGGGDELANYYKGVFQQAYKNYRWAVVLARIYQAKDDLDSTIKYYLAAIDNQPEKAELYSALAQIYKEKQDLPSAINVMNKAVELSNYEVTYVREAIRFLEEAGRNNEVVTLKAKLPPEPSKIEEQTLSTTNNQTQDPFALAKDSRSGNKEAINKYRKAFQAFYENPYNSLDVNSYSLENYAEAVHKEDSLTKILESFWTLRDKLLKEATTENSYNSARARELLQMLDGALPKIISDIVQMYSTGEELIEFHKDLAKRIETFSGKSDPNKTLFLLENIVLAANFLDLRENIINKRFIKDNQESLDTLVYFYESQGNYQKALEILEREYDSTKKTHYLYQIARFSALVGDFTKERQTFFQYYEKHNPGSIQPNDSVIDYYLNLLYKDRAKGREELLQLTKTPSLYRIQLINFLISKNEVDLARKAISNSNLLSLWKNSRNAELSVKLADYNPLNNQYFENILRFQNIGQMIKSKPKASEQLISDDWFEMAANYGRWLYKTPNINKDLLANRFLPAMLERRPQDPSEQQKLGEWYLAQKQLDKALAHLLNAQTMGIDSAELLSSIGSTYFLKGNKDKALDYWLKVFEKNDATSDKLWVDTLKNYGLVDKAREELLKRLIKNKHLLSDENIESYISLFESSFKENDKLSQNQAKAQAEFFINLCKTWPKDTFIAQRLIEKYIISAENIAPFYQILIERSKDVDSYDYEYRNYAQLSKNIRLLEEKLDHTNNFQSKEPTNDRYKWQGQYLQILLSQNKDKTALELIKEIEKSLSGRYMRPEWLRLANIELMLRLGNLEEARKELIHFVKIQTYPETTNVTLPNLGRLETVLRLLEKTNFSKEKDPLLQAYYERLLALEQCSLVNLSGFTDVVYRSGNIELGNNLLQLILEFGEVQDQAKAAKKLANLPNIKARSITARNIVTPSPTYEEVYNSISTNHVQTVAELATKYMQYNLAIEQRKRLKRMYGYDEVNRIELARLLAANNQAKEAVIELTSMIIDQTLTRSTRWQIMSLISNMASKEPELWKITEKVTDKEFKLALEANRLANLGEIKSAIKLINKEFNSVEIRFLLATLERRNNNAKAAIEILNQIPMEYRPFDRTNETSPLRQLIYLYSAINSPKAVLALIEKDYQIQSLLNSRGSLPKKDYSDKTQQLQLLKVLEQEQEYKTTLDLIALSANAAETLENFDLAVKLLEILKNSSSFQAQAKIETRINKLEEKRKPQSKNNTLWQINISLISR